jgi:glycerate 2-kinase
MEERADSRLSLGSNRSFIQHLLKAGLQAVDPANAVAQHLTVESGHHLRATGGWAADLRETGRVIVIGAGKGTAPMAQAVEHLLGQRIDRGRVVVKDGHGLPLTRISSLEASHPVPDARGAAAATLLANEITGLAAADVVIVLLSGGASALLPAPREGLSLADKQATSRLLLASGVAINDLNAVRKHLSWLKGGQLARLAQPARVLCLAVSDVLGDDLGTIGSGPFAPDATRFTDVAAIIDRAGLTDRLPPAVRDLIQRGVAGQEAETPFPGDPCFAQVHHVIVASNDQAVAAIAARAQAEGWHVECRYEPLQGEAAEAGRAFARRALARAGRPTVLIAGGETTVTLGDQPGLGGRNQEFALAAAEILAQPAEKGELLIEILAAGTDGNDGPTEAAGAVVDSRTWPRALAAGWDPHRHLTGHDAHPLLTAIGALLVTGPTRTNVMDVAIAVIGDQAVR